MRGLLAFELIEENERIYNFKENQMNEANASDVRNCPVLFEVVPSNATVTIYGIEKTKDNLYDLVPGTYGYSVSASGYNTVSGEITITEEDSKSHILKTINVPLSAIYYGGSSSGGNRVNESVKDKEDKKPEEENKDETAKEEPENTKTENNQDKSQKDKFENTFSDVSVSDWHYSAVKYVYENNLFKGTDKGFEPDSYMTRAMLVTVLHRLDSSKEAEKQCEFTDIPENSWYTKSVHWAESNNIINGITENTFAPDSEITREQMAVILYRYAMYKGYDVSVKNEKALAFADYEKISHYAVDAINYITTIGVLNGREGNILAAEDKATRAEVATMLKRFAEVKK